MPSSATLYSWLDLTPRFLQRAEQVHCAHPANKTGPNVGVGAVFLLKIGAKVLLGSTNLRRRSHAPSGHDQGGSETAEIADQCELNLAPGRALRTRVAGVFLFLPLLAKFGFDRLMADARYPGSKMISAASALLSLLTLKLLDKERRSHISDFNFDEALGLFAGLNIFPKKSFATDYSYRVGREQQQSLLSGWVRAIGPLMFPDALSFSLDFLAIPYRSEPSGLDRH